MIISHKGIEYHPSGILKTRGGSGPLPRSDPTSVTGAVTIMISSLEKLDGISLPAAGVPRPQSLPSPAFPRCLTGHNKKGKEVLLASLPEVEESSPNPERF
jgi:hypothetical protein